MPLIGRSRPPARSGPGPGSRKSERQKNARNPGPGPGGRKSGKQENARRAVPVRAVEKAESRKTRVGQARSGQ